MRRHLLLLLLVGVALLGAAPPVPKVPETVVLAEDDVSGRAILVGVPLRIDVGPFDDFVVLDPHLLSARVVRSGVLEVEGLARGQAVVMILAGGVTRAVTFQVEQEVTAPPKFGGQGDARWRYEGVGSYGWTQAFGTLTASWHQLDVSDGGLDPKQTEDAHVAFATQQELTFLPLISAHVGRPAYDLNLGDTSVEFVPGVIALGVRGASGRVMVGEGTQVRAATGVTAAGLCCDVVDTDGDYAATAVIRQQVAGDGFVDVGGGVLVPLVDTTTVPVLQLSSGWKGRFDAFVNATVLGQGVSFQESTRTPLGRHELQTRAVVSSRGLWMPRDGPSDRSSAVARATLAYTVRQGLRLTPLVAFTRRGPVEGQDDARQQLTAGLGQSLRTPDRWSFDTGAFRASTWDQQEGFFGATLGRIGLHSPTSHIFGGGFDVSGTVTDEVEVQSALVRSNLDIRPDHVWRFGPEARIIVTSSYQQWLGVTADYIPGPAFDVVGELGWWHLVDADGVHDGPQGNAHLGWAVRRNVHLDLRGQATLAAESRYDTWRTDLVLTVDGTARSDRIAGWLGLGGRVRGVVFLDQDANGVFDPTDEPVSGVPVSVYGRTRTTGDDGEVAFRRVAPGPKEVTIDRGSYFTVDGVRHEVDVPRLGAAEATFALSLGSRIEVRAFHDHDRDGRYQPGEEGVASAITLRGPGGKTWTRNATQGQASFLNLPNGAYAVELDPMSLPPGWIPAADTELTVVIDGAGVRSAPFPLTPLRTLSGRAWVDVNQNTRFDGADRVVAGAVVRLEPSGASVTTDAEGRFLFDDVPSGVLSLSTRGAARKVNAPTGPARMENIDLVLPEVVEEARAPEAALEVVALRILPGELFQRVGERTRLKVTAVMSDLSKLDVTDQIRLTSSDPRIVAVQGAEVEGRRTGRARIDVTWNGVPAPPLQVEVGYVPTAGLEVGPRELVVEMGDVTGVFARMLYVTGDWVDATELVTWSSSDTTVVTVDRDGVIHGIGPGVAEVRGELGGQRTPPVQVRVGVERAFPAALTIRPPGLQLSVNDTSRLGVDVALADGKVVDGASFVVWEVADPVVAEVVEGGRVIPHLEGTTEVRVVWKGVRSQPAVIEVLPPEGLLVTPAPGTLAVRQRVTLGATAILRNGELRAVEATYEVADPAIARVGPDGRLETLAPGTTTVTAAWRGASSPPAELVVLPDPIVAVEISPSPRLEVRVGGGAWIDATGVFAGGQRANLTAHATFEVGDRRILEVRPDGSLVPKEPGATLVRASVDGIRSTPLLVEVRAADDDTVPVRVDVGRSELRVLPRATARLSAEVVRSDGARSEPLRVTWRSEDRNIAVVDADGRVRGVTPGTTRVVAEVDGVLSSPVEVTVPLVVGMTVSPPLRTVPVGAELRLRADGVTAEGEILQLDRSVSWTTTDERIAWIDAMGQLHVIRPGTAEIRATADGIVSAPLVLRTVDAELLSLSASARNPVVVLGETTLVEALAAFGDGSGEAATDYVVWSSSHPEVMEVRGGLGIPGRPGQADLYATWLGRRSAPVHVEVLPGKLAGFTVDVPTRILVGAEVPLGAVAVTEDGQVQRLGRSTTFTSSEPGVLRIDERGRARALAAGRSTVTATLGDERRTVEVVVEEGRVASLAVRPGPQVVLAPGESLPLEVRGTLDDGAVIDLSSQVSWQIEGYGISVDAGTLRVVPNAQGTVRASWGEVSSSAVRVTAGR
ncbi:MAG: Ig-like domain-containing protein [Alphaproteobacteria bacterium]|nr:Ig-like domain-containing protein [Alphaproteobacteria bacterium]